MEKKDGATIRRERIQRICKRITESGMLPCDLDYLVAHIEYTEGIKESTALEYLSVIDKLGFIKIDWTLRIVNLGEVGNINNSNSKNVQ